MRILIAPDKFKGSLTAPDAARAIAKGVARAWPQAAIREIPVADGGEGTMEAIHSALGGEWVRAAARDPLGRRVDCRYLWLPDRTAVIGMSEASGMWRLRAKERSPLFASTFGTGELMLDAIRRGASRILVGLGGSATNDGGIGMASALGWRFLTSDGEPLDAVPANLLALTSIRQGDLPEMREVIALSDVRNPLLGPTGATRVFGPQKGVDAESSGYLEQGLENLADVGAHDVGCDFRNEPGAGAAGGLGFGLLTFCGAKIRPGFETIAEFLGLESEIAAADIILTGEGSLDAQTLHGKGPLAIAQLARKHGKRVVAFAGVVSKEVDWNEYFDAAHAIGEGLDPAESIRDAANLLEQCAHRTATLLQTL